MTLSVSNADKIMGVTLDLVFPLQKNIIEHGNKVLTHVPLILKGQISVSGNRGLLNEAVICFPGGNSILLGLFSKRVRRMRKQTGILKFKAVFQKIYPVNAP